MKLQRWEIWHDYYTYYNEQYIDLVKAANLLLKSELVTAVFHSDGDAYLYKDGTVVHGYTDIVLSDDKNHADLNFNCENDEYKLEGFDIEAWYQSSYLRYNEKRIFGESQQVPSNYLRFYLGKFEFIIDNDKEIDVYPLVKLYETGVIIVEYRMLGPERDVDIEEFINEYLNMGYCSFDRVNVPPALTKESIITYYNYSKPKAKIVKRFLLEYLSKKSNEEVDKVTQTIDDGEFSFTLSPIGNQEKDTFASIANTIFNTVGFIVSKPRRGLKYVLFGQKPFLKIGGYWVGKPNVYLIEFDTQEKSSIENEENNRDDFSRILARSMLDNKGIKEPLPIDQRIFDDYNVYLTLAVSLWVWSAHGKSESKEYQDINYGHLIYDAHTKVEFMEYVYMLHRGLYAMCSEYVNIEAILQTQEILIDIDLSIKESSHFGEVRDLFKYGWKQMGLNELNDSMNTLLKVKESQTNYLESKKSNRFAMSLTILFGFISVPQLASSIVKPLWEVFNLPLFVDEVFASLFYIGISSIAVVIIIYLLIFSYTKK